MDAGTRCWYCTEDISTRVETGEEERIKIPDVRTNLDDGGCPDREIAEVYLSVSAIPNNVSQCQGRLFISQDMCEDGLCIIGRIFFVIHDREGVCFQSLLPIFKRAGESTSKVLCIVLGVGDFPPSFQPWSNNTRSCRRCISSSVRRAVASSETSCFSSVIPLPYVHNVARACRNPKALDTPMLAFCKLSRGNRFRQRMLKTTLNSPNRLEHRQGLM